MNLGEAARGYRTLIVEGPDGISRTALLVELVREGFLIRHTARTLPHLDPTRLSRELLAGPGRIAVDGSIIRELVYGPLRHGRSRVTWIQALDFADAVAERDGALIHVTSSSPLPDAAGEAGSAARPHTVDDGEAAAVRAAYERAFGTLAQYVPVVTVDMAEPARPLRAPGRRRSQHNRTTRQLTAKSGKTT